MLQVFLADEHLFHQYLTGVPIISSTGVPNNNAVDFIPTLFLTHFLQHLKTFSWRLL